jgi:hypothetical protein
MNHCSGAGVVIDRTVLQRQGAASHNAVPVSGKLRRSHVRDHRLKRSAISRRHPLNIAALNSLEERVRQLGPPLKQGLQCRLVDRTIGFA